MGVFLHAAGRGAIRSRPRLTIGVWLVCVAVAALAMWGACVAVLLELGGVST
jgi:hypothetical protein